MKKNVTGVPEIRFPGFTDLWEGRRVGELAGETYGGGTPKTFIKEYWNGTIPWIQSSDITEHDVNNIHPKKFISDEAIEKSATKLVPENSIVIVTRVGVGKLGVMPFSYATSQDFLSLSKLGSDVLCTAYLLYKKKILMTLLLIRKHNVKCYENLKKMYVAKDVCVMRTSFTRKDIIL